MTRISPLLALAVLALALAACAAAVVRPAPPPANAAPAGAGDRAVADAGAAPVGSTPSACVTPVGRSGATRDDLTLYVDYDTARVYRVAGTCTTLIDTVVADGPIAFASLLDDSPRELPAISIDTWLMHGDRRRTHFTWIGDGYVESGPAEEIPGPHR